MATRLIFGGGDSTPNAFTVTDYTGRSPGDVVTSSITPSGFDSATQFSVSYSGTGISTVTVSTDNVTFSSTLTGQIIPGQTLYVKITAATGSSVFNTSNSYTVTFGYTGSQVSDTGTFNIRVADTSPDAFAFTDISNAEPDTYYTSSTITVTGLEPSYTFNVTSSGDGQIDAGTAYLSGAWATTKSVTTSATGTIQLAAICGSGSFNTARSVTANVGGVTDTFTVTTRDVDRSGSVTFVNLSNQALSTEVTSATALISGLEPNRSFAIVVVNSTNGTGKVAAATYPAVPSTFSTTEVTATTDASGRLNAALRITTSSSYGAQVVLTVGIRDVGTGVGGTLTDTSWSVTTLSADITPNPFSFTNATNVQPNTLTESNAITVSGLSPNYGVTVKSTVSTFEFYNPNTTTWSNSTVGVAITTNASGEIVGLKCRTISAATPNTAVTGGVIVGGVTGNFTVTTRALNFTGSAFIDVTNATQNTAYDSNVVLLTDSGFPNTSVTFYTTGGLVKAAAYNTTPTTPNTNSSIVTTDGLGRVNVLLRATSSSSFSTAVTVAFGTYYSVFGNSGTVPDSAWSVTTRAPDLTGTATNPGNLTNQAFSTTVSSGTFTISGLEPSYSHTISVTGSAGASVTAGGSTSTSRTVTSNSSGNITGVYLSVTTSSSSNTSASVNVSINGNTLFTWSATTSPGGELLYTTTGSTAFTMPTNYSSVSFMAVGGGGAGGAGYWNNSTTYSGGGGGGGGGLAWGAVTTSGTVYVGIGGVKTTANGGPGGASYITFNSSGSSIIAGGGGGGGIGTASNPGASGTAGSSSFTNATATITNGGAGGQGGVPSPQARGGGGGGGAGGYSGAGGDGGSGGSTGSVGKAGVGGGSGGGGGGGTSGGGGGGGGTGYAGAGTSGSGGSSAGAGGGKGSTGGNSDGSSSTGLAGANGGFPGGGGGGGTTNSGVLGGAGGAGVARIIWGTGVSFPNG